MDTNTSTNNIEQEIEQFWNEVYPSTSSEALYDTKFGKVLDKESREAESIAQSCFQPWLAILEQAISWLAFLHLVLSEGVGPKTEELRVPWVLTGAACSQAVAIRKLCLHGLDLPARAVLRSLIETFNILIVTTHDEELRHLYRRAESFGEAKIAWQEYFTEKKIQAQLAKIFEEFELEERVSEDFREWIKDEMFAGSQAVHVSYLAATLATAPYPADRVTFRPGMLGCATIFSIRTLAQTCRAIWFFSRVGFNLLIRPNPKNGVCLYLPSKSDTGDKIVVYGRYVLNQLILKHWFDDQGSSDELSET